MDPAAGKVFDALMGTTAGTMFLAVLALWRWWSTGPQNRALDTAREALSKDQAAAVERLREELEDERARADRAERVRDWWRMLAWWWMEMARNLRHAANEARATMQAVAWAQQRGMPLPEIKAEEWARLDELPHVEAPVPRPPEAGGR